MYEDIRKIHAGIIDLIAPALLRAAERSNFKEYAILLDILSESGKSFEEIMQRRQRRVDGVTEAISDSKWKAAEEEIPF